MSEITFTVDASEAIQRHIEGLQATLTKRNETIERLKTQLAEALTGEPNQMALGAAYRRGWKEAAEKLMETTRVAANSLRAVRKDAFEIYLEGDKVTP